MTRVGLALAFTASWAVAAVVAGCHETFHFDDNDLPDGAPFATTDGDGACDAVDAGCDADGE